MGSAMFKITIALAVVVSGIVDAAFVHVPLSHTTSSSLILNKLRRTNVTLQVKDNLDLYTTKVSIGSPPQQITLQVDTGCSSLWVNPDCENAGSFVGAGQACQAAGSFTSSNSRTFVATNTSTAFATGYSPFTGDVELESVQDVLRLGDVDLRGQTFGVATESHNETYGKLGLGPNATTGFARTKGSLSVLDALVNKKNINSRLYSLNLRSIDSTDSTTNGSLIFGGVDTAKYQGALHKLPILQPEQAPVKSYANWITIDSMSILVPPNPSSSTIQLPQNLPGGAAGTGALLDSSVPFIGLPANVTAAVIAALPTSPDIAADGTPLTQIDCGILGASGFLNFGFGSLGLSVVFRDIVVTGEIFGKPASQCYLMVYPSEIPVLGTPFLRSAYTVYDWDNQDIYVARAASCGEKIVEVGSGASAVSSISGICTPAPFKAKTIENRGSVGSAA